MLDKPLTEILRPKNLTEFIGNEDLVDTNGLITKLIEADNLPSLIFWRPPASGKTSLALLISQAINSTFFKLSAVLDGKSELRKILDIAEKNLVLNQKTILFLDEIHRWNKSQQDCLLPFIESGKLILIGATTENPSFSIISPLLSRCRILILKPHSEKNIEIALNRGIEVLKKIDINFGIKENLLKKIIQLSDTDMRFGLNTLEILFNLSKNQKITEELVDKATQKSLMYDKNGEEHYNLISAVHKSLRSSNATAGTYWIMRMLTSGEDPLYIARRLVRFASEDIGNSNPNALFLANQVFLAVKNLGMPECEVALIQLAEYLANSPKNNKSYLATLQAKSDIKKYGSLPVPMRLRNSPTKLMQEIGYGKGYEYDHDLKNKKSNQQCMPDKLKNRNYF